MYFVPMAGARPALYKQCVQHTVHCQHPWIAVREGRRRRAELYVKACAKTSVFFYLSDL